MILTPELDEARKKIRLLRDRLLIKQLPYVHPILATTGVTVQKGVVIAVGYGRRQRRKVAFKQGLTDGPPVLGPDGKTVMKFAKSRMTEREILFEDGAETGLIIPMQVKPGDVVEFGFRNITPIDFDRVLPSLQLGELLIVRQSSVYSIDPDESLNECLLWQQSAGYDRNGNFMSGAEDWHRA